MFISYFMIIMIGFIVNCPVISKKIARYPLISRLLSIDESGAGSYLRHAAAARHVLRSTRNGEDHGSSALR